MPENPVYSRDDGHFIYLATVELGQAGITEIYGSTHIFRHTRAKFYILNGGDAFKPCNKYWGIARWIWCVITSEYSGQRFSSNTESLARWSNMRIFSQFAVYAKQGAHFKGSLFFR